MEPFREIQICLNFNVISTNQGLIKVHVNCFSAEKNQFPGLKIIVNLITLRLEVYLYQVISDVPFYLLIQFILFHH